MAIYLGGTSARATLISPESLSALRRDADALRIQIDALSAEIAGHEAQVEALRRRREALLEGMGRIEALLGAESLDAPIANDIGSAAASGPPTEAPTDQSGGALTLADQIETVIRTAHRPLHYRDILGELQAAGIDVGGKDPAATLLSILANKRYESRFTRSDRGVYTLVDLAGDQSPKTRPSKRKRRRVRAVRKAS